jgi:uncharacterized membrane protein YfcA
MARSLENMDYLLICLVSLGVAGVTLFSGFGLGTVLLPAFALFFPLPVAIAATAVVHLANNLFKVVIVGREADRATVLRFGLPAAGAGIAGATMLGVFAAWPPLTAYSVAGIACEVTLVKLVIAAIIVASAVYELVPSWQKLSFDRRHLLFGGLLSGFFGGLSGQQGALRSAFLLNAGLTKQQFIGTGVVVAVMVDTVRLVVYGAGFYSANLSGFSGRLAGLVIAATLAAFAGSYLAARLVHKLTIRMVQVIVGVMLVALGVAMGLGAI